jgi:hypothetical protein
MNVIRRILIGTGAPDLSIRNGLSPDLSPAQRRAVISNSDIGQSNPLCHGGPLADSWNVQFGWLAAVLELRFRAGGEEYEAGQSNRQLQKTL